MMTSRSHALHAVGLVQGWFGHYLKYSLSVKSSLTSEYQSITFVGLIYRDRGRERTRFLRFLRFLVSGIWFSLEISEICLANWLQSSFENRNFLHCGHQQNIVRRSGLTEQLAFGKKQSRNWAKGLALNTCSLTTCVNYMCYATTYNIWPKYGHMLYVVA